MLLLFAISITPKKTLHDIFGCHKETNKSILQNGEVQLGMDGFDCSCQQPDLKAPFLEQTLFATITLLPILHCKPASSYTAALYENALLFSQLRGPPALL